MGHRYPQGWIARGRQSPIGAHVIPHGYHMSEDPGGPAIRWRTRAIVLLAFAVAVGGIVVFSGALPGMTPYYDAPTEGSPLVGVAVGLGLGSVYFVLGWGAFRRVQLFRGTPTSTVRSLPVGTVEVKGVARPVDEPLTAPLTGRDACAYELTVERKSSSRKGSSRFTELELRKHVPFRVDDGTGEVRVDPRGAELALGGGEEVEVPAEQPPPAAIAEWAEEGAFEEGEAFREGGEPDGEEVREELTSPGGRRRWITEHVLEPGETAYVWGGAHRREDADQAENVRNLVIREDEGAGVFYVSDKPEGMLTEKMVIGAGVLLAAALLFLVLGALVLLEYLGLL